MTSEEFRNPQPKKPNLPRHRRRNGRSVGAVCRKRIILQKICLKQYAIPAKIKTRPIPSKTGRAATVRGSGKNKTVIMNIKKLDWFKDNQTERAKVFSGWFEVNPEVYDECSAIKYEVYYMPHNCDYSLLGYAETAEKCKEIAQSYWDMLIGHWVE